MEKLLLEFSAGAFLIPYFHAIKSIIMGRGDKKTAKGKRFKGSFGKSRPTKKVASKKTEKKKTEQ
ncbi:MAG TPA: 30S ribosomal protein THX [Chitinophagaceae bacterium]|nr:30S ribosomal protein THX [Chitinophagaceae bacterium]